MRRADRLFEIIQVLRRSTEPQTAEQIAAQLETSRRTIYRDITTLISQRVPIRGEAGVGYVLDRGYDLPPLMLTPDEIEAVVLGSQWVVAHADAALARAAVDVLAKVAHVLPRSLRDHVDEPAVGTPPRRAPRVDGDVDVARLREWCRKGRKVTLRYLDGDESPTERTVWPFMIGYATTQVLVAWCELRTDFRHFRIDRMKALQFLDDRYPVKRSVLRRKWAQRDEASRR